MRSAVRGAVGNPCHCSCSRSFVHASLRARQASPPCAAAAPHAASLPSGYSTDINTAKDALLSLIAHTRRGAEADAVQRGVVEEATTALEALAPQELQLDTLLPGKWRLEYTTALDVLPIVGLDLPGLPLLGLPPPVLVGDIFQRFTKDGVVQNIIEFSLPPLLQRERGAVFTVDARYEVRSGRRIALTFEQAQLDGVSISPEAEALLAPALLPRGWLQQQLLLAIKELKLTFPFRSAQQVVQGAGVGAPYLLTFLDDDVLVGRAPAPAGVFIFTRVSE